jgi:hypothetical protein
VSPARKAGGLTSSRDSVCVAANPEAPAAGRQNRAFRLVILRQTNTANQLVIQGQEAGLVKLIEGGYGDNMQIRFCESFRRFTIL